MGLHMHRKLIAIITAVFMLMSVQAPAVFAADETADPSAVETQQEQISKDAKAPSEEAKPDEETQQQAAVKEEKSEEAEEEQTAPKQGCQTGPHRSQALRWGEEEKSSRSMCCRLRRHMTLLLFF